MLFFWNFYSKNLEKQTTFSTNILKQHTSINGSVKHLFPCQNQLFSASFFLVHVALINANELCSPRPSLLWRAVRFTLAAKLANLHVIRKGDLQRFIKKPYCLLTSSEDEAVSRMIRLNIDAFRQIGSGEFPSKRK